LSASERPVFVTEMVNVCCAPPAVTGFESNSLLIDRCTSSCTAVLVVSLVLLPGVGSVVPVESRCAVLWSVTLLSTVDASFTWIVKDWSAPLRSPLVLVQVTTWPEAEHAGSEPTVTKLRPLASVSVTWKPPVLSEGPPLCTVRT
jgi:hypothetical protein